MAATKMLGDECTIISVVVELSVVTGDVTTRVVGHQDELGGVGMRSSLRSAPDGARCQ